MMTRWWPQKWNSVWIVQETSLFWVSIRVWERRRNFGVLNGSWLWYKGSELVWTVWSTKKAGRRWSRKYQEMAQFQVEQLLQEWEAGRTWPLREQRQKFLGNQCPKGMVIQRSSFCFTRDNVWSQSCYSIFTNHPLSHVQKYNSDNNLYANFI